MDEILVEPNCRYNRKKKRIKEELPRRKEREGKRKMMMKHTTRDGDDHRRWSLVGKTF